MTTATKIHRQDREKPRGVAVCGRKARPDRMTDDPRAVTCGVCRTFAPDVRDTGPRLPTETVLDRLTEHATGDLVDLGRTERETARARAMEKLASKHRSEFRELYREELDAVKFVLEELD